MATPRSPWPAWAANDYYELRRLAGRVKTLAGKAQAIGHTNIYLAIELMSRCNQAGHQITNICSQLELHRGKERWPNWANRALARVGREGRHISAGARHALDGIEKDNWKMVMLGISHCLDHAGQMETDLLDGPAPAIVVGQANRIVEQAFEQE